MIKLIACDMDGTLLDSQKRLPPDISSVIRALKEQGVLFAVASGRQYAALRRDLKEIADDILFICENGALDGTTYSTLPTGMETTVKVTCGDTMLTSVVFGNVDYPVDMPIRLAINGDALMLFDKQSGNAVGQGSLNIQ